MGCTMEVRVKYFGFESLQEGFYVTLPEEATVQDLLEKLQEDRTDEEKTLIRDATIMVNDEKGHPDTRLFDKDSVLILIPLGGG